MGDESNLPISTEELENVSLPYGGVIKMFLTSVAIDGLIYYCETFACCFWLSVEPEYLLYTPAAMAGLVQQWSFNLSLYWMYITPAAVASVSTSYCEACFRMT